MPLDAEFRVPTFQELYRQLPSTLQMSSVGTRHRRVQWCHGIAVAQSAIVMSNSCDALHWGPVTSDIPM